MTEDLLELAGRTQEIYERHAARFDAERAKGLHERAWLERFCEGLAPGARVLDLGCGAGEPIAGYLIDQGFALTGVDASHAMIDIVRQRWPDGDWRVEDMRDLTVEGPFAAILGWNSFFHLTRDEQRAVVPALIKRLAPAGRLMLTVGPSNGEVVGHVGGDKVYHSSLALSEYAELIETAGATVREFVAEDPRCDFQTVLIAERSAA